MGKINTIKKLVKGDKRQILVACYNNIVHTGLTNIIGDKAYLKLTFRIRFGEKLDLDNPVSFNEKLQWLKLYDRNPKYVEMVDKIAVKDYVKKIIGEQYIIPTIGVWNDFEEINFSELPNQFVLKCSHDSGSVIVCNDKENFDINEARKKLSRGLKTDAFYWGREWPYKNVNRRILAETFIEDSETKELNDYKFMCFDGKVRCSFVGSERFSKDGLKITFFDKDWNVMPFERHYPKSKVPIKKPERYDEMIKLAEKLSVGIPFVRVDFYEVSGQIYFGELTFFPGSGWEEFKPKKWDNILGEWIVSEK